jgi:hypothetical protein
MDGRNGNKTSAQETMWRLLERGTAGKSEYLRTSELGREKLFWERAGNGAAEVSCHIQGGKAAPLMTAHSALSSSTDFPVQNSSKYKYFPNAKTH